MNSYMGQHLHLSGIDLHAAALSLHPNQAGKMLEHKKLLPRTNSPRSVPASCGRLASIGGSSSTPQ